MDALYQCDGSKISTDKARSFLILVLDLSSTSVEVAPSSSIKTASMIGIIIAVVAVLDIHIDKNAAGHP